MEINQSETARSQTDAINVTTNVTSILYKRNTNLVTDCGHTF